MNGNVLIIGRDQLFREGLKRLLKRPCFVAGGECRNLAEALDKADSSKSANLVILTLEASDSLDASLTQIGFMRRDLPAVKLVALTASLSKADLLRAIRAGVDAVLSKDISSDVLQTSFELDMQSQHMFVAPMEHLLAGETEPEINLPRPVQDEPKDERPAEQVSNLLPVTLPRSAGSPATGSLSATRAVHCGSIALSEQPNRLPLSEREGQILCCLVKGFSNKVIARELAIAETTVKLMRRFTPPTERRPRSGL